MPEIPARKSENTYTRRAFIQTLLAAPLALGATALMPEEAEAATKTIKIFHVIADAKVKAPTSWRKLKYRISMNPDYRLYYSCKVGGKTKKIDVLLLGWPSSGPNPTAKTKVQSNSTLDWQVYSNKGGVHIQANNIPYVIWQNYHGKASNRLSKKQATELLKISTGGRIKYATLIKWSKDKAKKQGEKAVRTWVVAKVLKKVVFK